jgi:hypothetical protein
MFQVCIIYAVVMYYNSRRRNAKLSRSALALPRCSPWVRLLMFGDDSSFLSMTGFSRLAFYALKDVVFTDVPVSRGRPMLLDKEGQLGLLLFYLGSRMQLKHHKFNALMIFPRGAQAQRALLLCQSSVDVLTLPDSLCWGAGPGDFLELVAQGLYPVSLKVVTPRHPSGLGLVLLSNLVPSNSARWKCCVHQADDHGRFVVDRTSLAAGLSSVSLLGGHDKL